MDDSPSSYSGFSEIVQQHRSYLLGLAVRLSGNRAVAEDLVQDTFHRALQRFDELRPDSHVRAWLARILTRLFLDHEKHNNVVERAMAKLSTQDDIENDPIPPEISYAALRDAIEQLEPELRESAESALSGESRIHLELDIDVVVLNNLARLYQAHGEYAQATPLFERTLRIRETALGPEHPDVAASLDNLATLYRAQGAYAQAAPLLERALRIREAALGADHPDVATSLNNLAEFYQAQGLYARAEPLFEEALRIYETALGPEHPDVATVLNNLARLYQAHGEYAQATPLFERTLRIRETALGPEHPDVAASLDNLATLYRAQGAYAQAAPLLERALRIREAAHWVCSPSRGELRGMPGGEELRGMSGDDGGPPSSSGSGGDGGPPSSGSGGDGGPPSSGSGGDGGPPRNTAVTRHADVSCPAQVVRTCDRFPVTVALVRSAPDSSAIDASFEVRSDLLVDVLLSAPGLRIIGPAHIQISTEGERGVFFLRPDELGKHSVTLDFAQGGNPLGTISIQVEVVDKNAPYDAKHHHPRALHMYDGAEPPDYVLLISYEAGAEHELRFCLRSRGDFDQGRTFSPVRLLKAPEEFMRRKYRDLEALGRDVNVAASAQQGTPRAVPPDEIGETLEKLGYQLWRQLIPPDFKEYYAKHRQEWRDRTFVILSDEPSIPWELVWPYDAAAGTWEDPDPWCLTLRLSRWLRRDEQGNGSAGPPPRLSLTQLVTLIPSDTGLPAVRAESEYLCTFVESHGVCRGNVPAVKRQVLSALSAGSYDWLHAAAHGSARDPADQTISIWLENGEALTPDDIVGPQIERHIRARRPAFVLNACTVARSGWELTGMSGWANQLIKVGAGLFLAPLWSVTDDVAQVFVQTFYNELANNVCVADAMREARMTARAVKGDPTWMAYVLFAHPNARVAFGTTRDAPF